MISEKAWTNKNFFPFITEFKGEALKRIQLVTYKQGDLIKYR